MNLLRRFSITFLIAVLIVGLGVFIGCEGPNGPEGPRGPQGEVGPVGPAGEDGSVMYAGPGAPTSDIGNEGDYYLNTDAGEYYGPKNSNGWGNPIVVLMGEDGQDGSQIYSGSGAPGSSLGNEGDYYLDKSNYDLYGPKSASGWGTPINLKGADGNANVTLYVFQAADYTSGSPSNTVSISGFSRENILTSQWEFAFTRGRFMQFIPGKIDLGGSNRSEFTVELFYTSNGDAEFKVELINGGDYYPDQLLIFKTVPTTVNKQVADQPKKTFEAPSLDRKKSYRLIWASISSKMKL